MGGGAWWSAGWGRSGRRVLAAGLLAGGVGLPAAARSADPPLRAQPAELAYGATTTLTGTLVDAAGDPVGGQPVELQVAIYPSLRFVDVAHGTTAADGGYGFPALRPQRNVRYRVRPQDPSLAATPSIVVFVDAPAVLHSYDQGPGRTMLTLLVSHARELHWGNVSVSWYLARAGTRTFRLAATTRSRELRPGTTYATATVNPPALHFVYRVCLNPPGQGAVGPPAAHAPCPRHDFTVPR